MAAVVDENFAPLLRNRIMKSNILVVGAGGIGCEILKNLAVSGFPKIEIIDLDTIDLSNLNRQFLFQREHVGKSKAIVARESVLKFNPDVDITAYHDSITSTQYGVNFFKKFDVVLNALDNRAARNHVNRMCLNAEVPLVESGTAGYNGQVELIQKGLTQCYECTPKAAQKTFPGCTIRNTPSEPIHCIVWAKHLFNQLFGEASEEEDISPDMADPEANENKNANGNNDSSDKTDGDTDKVEGDSNNKEDENKNGKDNISESGDVKRVNTRQWAKDVNYDATLLFDKFFHEDIKYLLSMSNLWKSRKPPCPVKWDNALLKDENLAENFMRDYHKIWSLAECAEIFKSTLMKLRENYLNLEPGDSLVWDKDDQPVMDFVAVCANIRSYIFGIGRKSRFEIKSMAGNIIPAIATTNAITAGIVVLHALRILESNIESCKTVYIRSRPNPRNQVIIPEKQLSAPNPNCYVCSKDPAIHLRVDTKLMRMKELRDDVLIKTLNMINPDVIHDAKGVVLISSEEGETECNENKLLSEMDIVDGVVLKCDDFFQNYELTIIIIHVDMERDGQLFEVVADKNQLKPKEEKSNAAAAVNANASETIDSEGPTTSKRRRIEPDDDDDCCVIDDDEPVTGFQNSLTLTSPKATDSKQTRLGEKRKSAKISIDDDVATISSDEAPEVISSDDDASPTQCKRPRKSVPSDVITID